MGGPARPWNEEYRTLAECYPDEVFCVDQKLPPLGTCSSAGSSGHCPQKRVNREGAYEISTVAVTGPSTNHSGYPTNTAPSPQFLGSFQTMPTSPKRVNTSSARIGPMAAAQPLLVATFRPPGRNNLEMTNRIPPAYLAPDGRLVTADGGYYGSSEAYQTLDPNSLPKGIRKQKDSFAAVESAKVTFNLEMVPMSQGSESTSAVTGESEGGFGRLLKNDILGGHDNEDSGKSHNVVVYGKSAHHSSFV